MVSTISPAPHTPAFDPGVSPRWVCGRDWACWLGQRGWGPASPRVGDHDVVEGRVGAAEAREPDLDYHRVGGAVRMAGSSVLLGVVCRAIPRAGVGVCSGPAGSFPRCRERQRLGRDFEVLGGWHRAAEIRGHMTARGSLGLVIAALRLDAPPPVSGSEASHMVGPC